MIISQVKCHGRLSHSNSEKAEGALLSRGLRWSQLKEEQVQRPWDSNKFGLLEDHRENRVMEAQGVEGVEEAPGAKSHSRVFCIRWGLLEGSGGLHLQQLRQTLGTEGRVESGDQPARKMLQLVNQ